MRLSVTKTISTTFSFYLRHIIVFYPLVLFASLPTYIYSLLIVDQQDAFAARPWWEQNIALTGIEAVLGGLAIAVMTRMLMHDRRGTQRPLPAALAEVSRLLPRVCGTALIFSAIVNGGFLLAEYLVATSLVPAIFCAVFAIWGAVIFSVAVPVAASDDGGTAGGVFSSMSRAAELSKGSRLRLLAILVICVVPLIALVMLGAGFAMGGGYSIDAVSPLWIMLVGTLISAFFSALTAVLYEALLALKEGPAAQETVAVFD
jgi:hypothetical protein